MRAHSALAMMGLVFCACDPSRLPGVRPFAGACAEPGARAPIAPWIDETAPSENVSSRVFTRSLSTNKTETWSVSGSILASHPNCSGGDCVATIYQLDVCIFTGACEDSGTNRYLALSNCLPMDFRGQGEVFSSARDATRFSYRSFEGKEAPAETGVIDAPVQLFLRYQGNVDIISRYSGTVEVRAAGTLAAADLSFDGQMTWRAMP